MSQMDALMKEINKEFKGDILHRGLAAFDYERIPFTSPRLNYMTYGGIPKGKLIEFYGEEHGGKTTTALDIVANYQTMENAKGVVYADLENTLDSVWATKLGVDFTRDDIWVMNPTNQGAETIFEKILQMIATDEVGLVVIDSLGVMVSNQALEKSVEDKTYGGIAMALTNFSKKAEMLCHKHNCTIIGINQMRDDMNSMYGGVTTTGGKAWKHNCFSGNTRFVTDRGLRRFRDCKDGEIVTVVDKDGELREAQVHYYGKQMLQRVRLHTPNQQFEVVCTPDHRWVLADDSVTTNLRVGDKLYYRPDNTTHMDNGWVVESIEPFGVAGTYCVEEPVTHTFTLERGIVTGNCSVRLEFRRGRFFDDKYKEVSRSAENPAGNYVQVSMAKNKTCPPKRHTGFYTLRYEVGIDYLYDLIEVGIKYGIIDKAGAWYSIIDPNTGELIVKLQGQNGVYTYLEDPDNMEVLAKIESYIEAQTDKD